MRNRLGRPHVRQRVRFVTLCPRRLWLLRQPRRAVQRIWPNALRTTTSSRGPRSPTNLRLIAEGPLRHGASRQKPFPCAKLEFVNFRRESLELGEFVNCLNRPGSACCPTRERCSPARTSAWDISHRRRAFLDVNPLSAAACLLHLSAVRERRRAVLVRHSITSFPLAVVSVSLKPRRLVRASLVRE